MRKPTERSTQEFQDKGVPIIAQVRGMGDGKHLEAASKALRKSRMNKHRPLEELSVRLARMRKSLP